MSQKNSSQTPEHALPDYRKYDYSLRFTAIRLWIIYAVFLLLMLLTGALAGRAGNGILKSVVIVIGGVILLVIFRALHGCFLSHIGNELFRMKKRLPNVLKNILYLAGGIGICVIIFRTMGTRTETWASLLGLVLLAAAGGVSVKGLVTLFSHAVDLYLGRGLK